VEAVGCFVAMHNALGAVLVRRRLRTLSPPVLLGQTARAL